MSEKILIIDDNEDGRDNIQTLLEEMGFSTIIAIDGIDGIIKAREFNPELIICDILMPNTDGYTVIKELKKSKKTCNIPFIYLSAKTEHSDFRKGMELGADDYLTKPVEAKELLNAINVRLNKNARMQNKYSSVALCNTEKQKSQLSLDENIFLPLKDGYYLLGVKDIDYILSSGAYTNIYHHGGKKILVRKLLKEWNELLPSKDFTRIHRNTIINMHAISRIEKWFNNSLKIYLKNYEDSITASRRFSMKFRKDMKI